VSPSRTVTLRTSPMTVGAPAFAFGRRDRERAERLSGEQRFVVLGSRRGPAEATARQGGREEKDHRTATPSHAVAS
jgi:hypothetical protein